MSLLLDPPTLIEYDIFNINPVFTDEKILLADLSISQQGFNSILSYERYRPVNTFTNNLEQIGYRHKGYAKYGLTEEESYKLFVTDIAETSMLVKQSFRYSSVIKLTQYEFDCLMSLYFSQLQIKTLVGNAGTYDLIKILEKEDPLIFASVLHDSKYYNRRRRLEADMFILATYTNTIDRTWLRNEGIQWLRLTYPNFTSSKKYSIVEQKEQAKVSYYREIKRFFQDTNESEQLLTKNIVDKLTVDNSLNIIQ